MVYQHKYKKDKGFSLVELVVVISIFSIFVLISDTAFVSYKEKINFQIDKDTIVQVVRRAQSNAQKELYDSNWGVHFASSTITLFKGSSYQSRDTSYDQPNILKSGIIFSGEVSFVFDRAQGTLDNSYLISALDSDGQNIQASINKFGVIQYE